MNPLNQIDAYKLDHRRQYPTGTQFVYSNLTPRSSRVEGQKHVVNFGLQAFLKRYCVDGFKEWFARPEAEVCAEYATMTANILGPNDIGTEHIAALHRLKYLPLRFKSLPEGNLVPLGVPLFTVENTNAEFFWLVNYIETVLSSEIWMPATSATTAFRMRTLLEKWAEKTGGAKDFTAWQGHDFSFRGHSSMDSAAASGAGHLISFTGTDTIPAIDWVNKYYPGADNGFIGGSVAATEHSVMCAGGKDGELDTFKHLIKLYPSGILSVVSDTWDLWKVLNETLPALKEEILARNGKLVIRPDSGNPADIICGTPNKAGALDCLFNVFGGTVNSKGYRELDPHVGLIYGDSISYDLANEICERLEKAGYATTNVVFGIGSYTYQHVTRDTYGFAMKATHAIINDVCHDLYKDPVTDREKGGSHSKKSAKGRLAVLKENGEYKLLQEVGLKKVDGDCLQTVWEDGKFVKTSSFAEVRARLAAERNRINLTK